MEGCGAGAPLVKIPHLNLALFMANRSIYFLEMGESFAVETSYRFLGGGLLADTKVTGNLIAALLPVGESGPVGVLEGRNPNEIYLLGADRDYKVDLNFVNGALTTPTLTPVEGQLAVERGDGYFIPKPSEVRLADSVFGKLFLPLKPWYCGDFDFAVSLGAETFGIVEGDRLYAIDGPHFSAQESFISKPRISWSKEVAPGAVFADLHLESNSIASVGAFTTDFPKLLKLTAGEVDEAQGREFVLEISRASDGTLRLSAPIATFADGSFTCRR
jgi:hypothetical protein